MLMKHKESMKGRLQRLLLMQYKKNEMEATKLVALIEKNYSLLQGLVRQEIEQALTHAQLNDRITQAEAYRLNKDWQQVLKDHPELKEFSDKQLMTHLSTVDQALSYALHTHLTANTMKNQGLIKEALEEAYLKTFLHVTYQIQQGTGVYQQIHNPYHVSKLVTEAWVGHENFIQRLSKNKDKTLKELGTILKQGYINQKTPQQMVKDCMDRLNVNQTSANRLVYTEMANMFGQATADSYEANSVEEYEILATLDKRTSKLCQSLDGQRFRVSEKQVAVNYPPFHPCCRTTTVPVVSRFASGKRWSKDADGVRREVEDMTYEEWSNKYLTR